MFRFICVVFVCSLTWQDAKVDVRERPESFEVARIAKGHRIASAHLSKWYRVKATEKSGWLRVHVKGLADDPLAPLVRAYTVQADDLLKKIIKDFQLICLWLVFQVDKIMIPLYFFF